MREEAGPFTFDLGSAIMSEYDGDDFPGLQIAEYGDDQASCPTMEMHAPYGVYHRPLDPDKDGDGKPIENRAAQVLYAWEGSRPHAWLLEDPRVTKLLPLLKPGETIFYGPIGNFLRCHADGRVTLYTTDDGTPNGKTIARYVSPDPLKGGIVDMCPWGTSKINQTGYHLVLPSGAEIHGGGMGGVPAPVGALVGSYWRFVADGIGLHAKAIALGPGPLYEPVARALSLKAYLGLVVSALGAVTSAIASLNTNKVGPPGDVVSLAAAMTALSGATALLETMTSATVNAS